MCNGVSLLTDLVDLQLHILSFIIYKCSSKLLSKFSPTGHHACAFLVGTGVVYGAGGVESICTLNVCKMCDFFSLDRSLEEHSLWARSFCEPRFEYAHARLSPRHGLEHAQPGGEHELLLKCWPHGGDAGALSLLSRKYSYAVLKIKVIVYVACSPALEFSSSPIWALSVIFVCMKYESYKLYDLLKEQYSDCNKTLMSSTVRWTHRAWEHRHIIHLKSNLQFPPREG